MRVLRTATFIAAAAIGSTAYAAQPEYVMSCEDIISQLHREATDEAKARFADLSGACMGVVDRDGELYMHTTMVLRRIKGDMATIYLPATDRTFDVDINPSARVTIGNRKTPIRRLERGQELNIYVPVDKFTQPIIDEVAFETEADDEIVIAPAVLAPALPTTG